MNILNDRQIPSEDFELEARRLQHQLEDINPQPIQPEDKIAKQENRSVKAMEWGGINYP